jgi:Mn-dependent DtxR family transcriptional regulator
MAYREVTMIEITEVLRQWMAGAGRKRIARMLGVDPKTVRHYVRAARECGLVTSHGDDPGCSHEHDPGPEAGWLIA